jgi:hypothetical protein
MSHYPFPPIISGEPATPAITEAQRPYDPPAVVYEARLEVRAGSVLNGPQGLDLMNPE